MLIQRPHWCLCSGNLLVLLILNLGLVQLLGHISHGILFLSELGFSGHGSINARILQSNLLSTIGPAASTASLGRGRRVRGLGSFLLQLLDFLFGLFNVLWRGVSR